MEAERKPVVDISVLTPSLNYGRFIEDALLSTHAQPDRNLVFEHIVQDGQSSDDTIAMLSSFDGNLDWSSEADLGQSDALNRALARAEGRWIAWLNADEFFMPGGLAQLVRVGERTDTDVVYGDCVIIDEDGCLVRLQPQHHFSRRVLSEYGCFIASSSVVFRRSMLGEAPWDVGIRRVMDWDLFLKLAANGAVFRHVPFPVGAFRLHPAQVTSSPWHEWIEEDASVASRHGQPPDHLVRWSRYRVARRWHRFYKLMEGAYLRELRARALLGKDIRWFHSEEGQANTSALLRRCYGWRSAEVGRKP